MRSSAWEDQIWQAIWKPNPNPLECRRILRKYNQWISLMPISAIPLHSYHDRREDKEGDKRIWHEREIWIRVFKSISDVPSKNATAKILEPENTRNTKNYRGLGAPPPFAFPTKWEIALSKTREGKTHQDQHFFGGGRKGEKSQYFPTFLNKTRIPKNIKENLQIWKEILSPVNNFTEHSFCIHRKL